MNIGDLIKWIDRSTNVDVMKVGILLAIMDDRGHYSVLKILTFDGGAAVIKYLSDLPEIISTVDDANLLSSVVE